MNRAQRVYEMRFGNCPDPDSRAADGSRCGKRAASVRPDKGPKGDCFENCAREITLHSNDPSMRLVHGFVEGQGDIEGVRYPHSWLEYDVPLPEEWASKGMQPIRTAKDITTPERLKDPLELPAELYRSIGQATVVAEYTADEARRLAARSGHWGPWAPELLRWYGHDE